MLDFLEFPGGFNQRAHTVDVAHKKAPSWKVFWQISSETNMCMKLSRANKEMQTWMDEATYI